MSSSFAYQPSNPFSTQHTSPKNVRYRFSARRDSGAGQAHVKMLLEKLQSSRLAVIVGPHGTGKSTLLHTLLPTLQEVYPKVAFQQLNNDPTVGWVKRMRDRVASSKRIRKVLYELPQGALLMIDGWEQLSWLARRRIASTAVTRKVTVLTTAHTRLPGWTVLHETRCSSELVRCLAKDLLKDSPHRIKKLVEQQLKQQSLDSNSNIRELWFQMYDVVEDAQQLPSAS